ncbi:MULTISPECIES: SDR family oxidoreductase [unclassified Pseudomonas]|uniref:SDR family oxidoreductase n=1 Tax=unclassified Pseudomonas TaxID=196821 RepID=UPI0025F0B108|nr:MULTISPECIES: SDR family oxidoreductase [unclassified Pseudomonas]
MTKTMFKPDILAGQRILVTGGGTGLGRILAASFADCGATVYICSRRQAVVQDTARAINESVGTEQVKAMVCDLRNPSSIDSLLEAIWEDGGALTGLVNNAAANFIARAETISVNGFNAIAETTMRGTFLVTTGCARRWIAAGQAASVVSILTTWVWNGGPFAAPAAMSKSGLLSMTQSLAVEWGRHGIRLNAVCPGAFPTPGMSSQLLTDEQGFNEAASNPMRRHGRPEELCNLLTFLLAPGSEFISAQTIAIDGAGYQGNGANFAALTEWSDDQWTQAREKIRSNTSADKNARQE